jgi:APA family basic amino acid/polyamine antiporter
VLTVSLTIYALLSVVMIFFMETFDRILSFTIFLDCIGMAFSAGTLFILRRRQADAPAGDTYRMRLYPWMPLLFIAVYSFVAYSIARDKPTTALTAVAVLAAFVIIYFVSRKKR